MYSSFLKNILLPLGSLFFSGNYNKYLKLWEKYDGMSETELLALQQKKLSHILALATTKVPYYRNLKLPEGTPLKDFPILTKTLLRTHTPDLVSDSFSIGQLDKNHSSGSSGVQSFTYMTHDHKFYLRALQTHWWTWGGYAPGETLVQTGISPKRGFVKKLKDVFFKVEYLEAFSLDERIIEKQLSRVKNKRTKHIAGYPSAINTIAEWSIAKKQSYGFKSIISYGDKLFPKHLKNFKAASGSPNIVSTYGCAEGLLMACQTDLPYYYIMTPHVYIEIVDDEGLPVKEGTMGHILVTSLTNEAMPLIRYQLGDMGILLPKESYPTHRNFQYPLLQQVIGRETDVIKAPNGNVLVVHSFTGIFEYYEEIKQFKIIQKSATEILVEYISHDGKILDPSVHSALQKKLNALAENSMIFSFDHVATIAPTASGKPQIIEIRSRK